MPEINDVGSMYRVAVAEHKAGRIAAADALYRQILDRDCLYAPAWYLLGVALHQQGDSVTAIEYVERAIGLNPIWPAYYTNLGSIYASVGGMKQAERVLRQAIAIAPRYAAAHASLGHVLSELSRCDEAIDCFRRALELAPQEATAWVGLGYAYSELGLTQECIASYRRAVELSKLPIDRILAATQLPLVYESRAEILRWRERLGGELDALLAEGVTASLIDRPAAAVFSLPHQGFNDLEIQRKLAKLYRPPPLPPDVWKPSEGGKIRVGFLSSFFSQHTIGKLVRGLITRLSRADFHVTLFSVGAHDDVVAQELSASADRYVLVSRDLQHARRAILENSVDVLLFTDIGMNQTTYSLAFSRLAPVQCTTWGHPETTGLETIDYFLSSSLMETPEADAHYSERLVRLPSLTFYYYRSQLPQRLVDRAAFGLPEAGRLYACPQTIYKFHPDFDTAIAGILRRDPEGYVVLIRWAYPQADELLQRRLASTMPDVADRIIFIRRLQQPEFMNFLTLIDVMLDPFPYGGGNSSLEAFSFGVPVVTLPTEFLRGRITQAFCRRLGIDTCIARDMQDYVAIATKLGTDLVYRKVVHDQIIAGQPRLFEDDTAVRDLEQFFRQAVVAGETREPGKV